MSQTMEFTTEFDEEVTIEYDYTAGCRGARENGVPIEPDSPAEIEFLSVTDCDGEEVALSEHDTEAAIERAFEDVEASIEDAKAEAAISRWEDERDGYYDRW